MRLIRSKGVGVWFVSRKPVDIPDNVLEGSSVIARSQRFACAFFAKRSESSKAAAKAMRFNPAFDTEKGDSGDFKTGEALISFL